MGKEAVRAPFRVRLPAAAAGSQTHKDFFDKLTGIRLWPDARFFGHTMRYNGSRSAGKRDCMALCDGLFTDIMDVLTA